MKNKDSYSGRVRATKIFRHVICILLCILSLFPFYILFVNSTLLSSTIQRGIHFLPGKSLGSNFRALLNWVSPESGFQVTVWGAMRNSAIITVPTTILQVYFATVTAYGLTVYNYKLKNAAWAFIYAIMMIPTQVSIVGFMRFMMKINLYNTYWPLILPAIAAPSTVYFMKQYMQGGLSLEIVEAARIDGAGEFKTFNRIVLPLMKPAMATQAIFAFVASWNNLYNPTMLLTSTSKSTLPMFVSMLKSNDKQRDYGVIYTGLLITILPIFVAYFLLSKYIVAGVALGGVKE